MDQQILIVLGLVCFGALAFVLLQPSERDKASKRVAALNTAKSIKRSGGASTESQNKERRKKLADSLAALENKTKNLKKKRRLSMSQMLEQAGLTIKPKQFYIGSAISAVLFGLIGVISALDQRSFAAGGRSRIPALDDRLFERAAQKEICR